jgi:hypothetical protein
MNRLTTCTQVQPYLEANTMRFSRTLHDRNPYTRSSQAWIVTEDDVPMNTGDLWVCIVGVLCIVGAVGWLL